MCPCRTLSELPDTSSFPAGSMQRLYTELMFPEVLAAGTHTHIASKHTSSQLIKIPRQIMELHLPLTPPPPHPVHLLLIHSPILPFPSPPLSSSPPLLSPPLPLYPPPTSDGIVGGCEVGQCVEVPQEDAVLQTTADGHLSLGGVGQSFDVVLVCPQCGRALPRLGVPQLQSGVRGGREDWSHKREMVAQLQSPPLPQHTHSLFLPPWQRTMSLTQSVWCSMARTY